MKKLILLLLLIPYLCFAEGISNAPLNIEEEDGSPSTFPYKLKTTNGSLTDNGDGTTSLSTTAGNAPTTADYLVGTAQSGLSAEIVVGTTALDLTNLGSTLVGGSATTADLNLKTTSGVGAAGADMHFLVGNNGATEAMTILNSGKVGIGAATPTYNLVVNGSSGIDFNTYIELGAAGQDLYVYGGAKTYFDANAGASIYGNASGVNTDLLLTTRGTGKVGINVAVPTAELDVLGTIIANNIGSDTNPIDYAYTDRLRLSGVGDSIYWTNVYTGVLNVVNSAFFFGVSSSKNRAFIFGDSAFRDSDFLHTAQANPTIFIQSVTNPATNSTQWLSLAHNQTDGVISTGTGDLQLTPSTGFVGIGVAPWEALTINGDAVITDTSPHLAFRDSSDNTTFVWHLDTANTTYGIFQLWQGTDSGAGFNVGPPPLDIPTIHIDSSNNVTIPKFIAEQTGNGIQTTTLGVGATTFAITKNIINLTGAGGGNTIATITGGKAGQILTIIFQNSLVTITDTNDGAANTVDLSGAFTSADDTTLTLVYDGTLWREISRAVN